jgi:hypothetical protein
MPIGRSCSALTLGGTASDNLGLKAVTWTNSRGGSGSCNGTTAWSAAIPLFAGGNVVTVKAEDAAGNSATDVIAVDYVDALGSTVEAWNGLAMVSVPLVPDQSDPKLAIGFYGDRWLMFDAAANDYIGYGDDPNHLSWFIPADQAPGRGFWAYFSEQGNVPCGSVKPQDQPYVVSLKSGWNLVGQPFISPVKWSLSDIKVRSGAIEKSLADAVEAGWIKDYAWGWTPAPTVANVYGGSYYLVVDAAPGTDSTDTLQPWQAYWIKALRDCDLVLPAPERVQSSGIGGSISEFFCFGRHDLWRRLCNKLL